MCSSRKILWSLLLLSLVEVGLGVASIVLGAVGISWVRGEHKPQQGDASPVWSGLCVRPGNNSYPYFQPLICPPSLSIHDPEKCIVKGAETVYTQHQTSFLSIFIRNVFGIL